MADARRVTPLALASLLLSACGSSAGAGPAPQRSMTRLDPPFAVNGAALDGTTSPYSLVESTDKDLTLVFFGYINCPDICGTVMSTLASAMSRLGDEERSAVDVVFVTTDPARDTPELADEYASNFDPDFIGLSGDLETIKDVALPLGVAVEKGDKLPSGGYDVTHGTQVVAIDGDNEGIAYWSQDVSSAQLAVDVRHLLKDAS